MLFFSFSKKTYLEVSCFSSVNAFWFNSVYIFVLKNNTKILRKNILQCIQGIFHLNNLLAQLRNVLLEYHNCPSGDFSYQDLWQCVNSSSLSTTGHQTQHMLPINRNSLVHFISITIYRQKFIDEVTSIIIWTIYKTYKGFRMQFCIKMF